MKRNLIVTLCGVLAVTAAALTAIYRRGLGTPAFEGSLSLFEPHAGGCVWSRYEPARDRSRQITRFPEDCEGAHVSWSLANDAALVWFAPEGVAAQEVMLYRVDTATGHLTRLPIPDQGEPERYLYDGRGRIMAFVVDPQGGNGVDVEVSALVLQDDRAWEPVETKPSRCCEAGAPGVAALVLFQQARDDQRIWRRQSEVLLTTADPASPPPKEVAPPALGAGPWVAVARSAGSRQFVVRRTQSEPLRFGGEAYLFANGKATPLPDDTFAASDVVQVTAQGEWVLMTEWATGSQPHLYDVAQGRLVFKSSVATGAVFWPIAPRGDDDEARLP